MKGGPGKTAVREEFGSGEKKKRRHERGAAKGLSNHGDVNEKREFRRGKRDRWG